jgi:hypothetical protein
MEDEYGSEKKKSQNLFTMLKISLNFNERPINYSTRGEKRLEKRL